MPRRKVRSLDADDEPDETATQYLHPGEYASGDPRFPIRRTGHESLRQITRTVAVHVKDPLQSHDDQKWHHSPFDGRRERQHSSRLTIAIQGHDAVGQVGEPSDFPEQNDRKDDGSAHGQAELENVGGNDAPQTAGCRIETDKEQQQRHADHVIGGRKFGPVLRCDRGEIETHPAGRVQDRPIGRIGQPGVPGQEKLRDLERSQQDETQGDRVDHQPEIDRLGQPQRQAPVPAVPDLDEFSVGQNSCAPPKSCEQKSHQEECETIDPEPPQRENAGGGDHGRLMPLLDEVQTTQGERPEMAQAPSRADPTLSSGRPDRVTEHYPFN